MTFKVQIDNYEMDLEAGAINEDGSVPFGRPNPERISWSKENIIKTHEIPYPKHKTSRTAQMTLWKLNLEFIIMNNTDSIIIQDLVDNVGPYDVRTAFKSLKMYIESFSADSESGLDDYHFRCSMRLKEAND